jgi:hypothetical protein
VEATGARRRNDWLRIATWRLDAAAPISPTVLTAAAKQAFAALDLPLAERLARGAFDAGEDLAAGGVLWRVLFLGGRAEETEQVMNRLFGLPMSDSQRGELAFGRAHNLFWGLRQIDTAHAVLRETRETIHDRAWQLELDVLECDFQLLKGRPRDALNSVTPLRLEAKPHIAAQVLLCQGIALTHLGRLAEARAVLDEAAESISHCTDVSWVAEARHLYCCYVEVFAGRLDTADELVADFYTHAVETNWPFPLGLACGVSGTASAVARTGADRGSLGTGGPPSVEQAGHSVPPQLSAR